jgi:tetratricopeptide (TPR) repeat protein
MRPAESAEAEVLTRRGDWPALQALASRWLQADPGSASAWQALSRATFELGRYRASLDAYRKVVDFSGRTGPNLMTLGRIALHALDFDTAQAALAEAEPLAPDAHELLAARGLLAMYLGQFAAAEINCRRCLDRCPEFIPAYTTLSRLMKGRLSDREMSILSRVMTQPQTPLDHRIPAAFALAHGLDARGDSDAAFRTYERAHALSRERHRREGRKSYDPALTAARMHRLTALSPGLESAAQGRPGSRPAPIFIVGMPRSGTTLIESVLAAHSRVHASGERPQMQQLLNDCLRAPDAPPALPLQPGLLEKWREFYLADIGSDVDHFTDKNPLNFEAAGLIAQLFPAASIIHLRRNPVETCFSIYRNEFSKFWNFTDRLGDIGHYYGQYAKLVDHWERVLGQRFHSLQYEQFAGAFETMAPALVADCGLDWEEQCRHFQTATRAIPTFSAVEARQAVRVRIGAAERFRPFLGALLETLEAAGVDLGTGALRPAA